MKETLEIRINNDFIDLLFKPDEYINSGSIITVVEISKEDPRYNLIPIIDKEVTKKYERKLFYGWQIKRKYTKHEMKNAKLLHLKIKKVFEPSGEECGVFFDENVACNICGANRKQTSSLILKKGTIPKKDIAKTIGGEVIVSERFVNIALQRNLKGLVFSPIYFKKAVSKYYQLSSCIDIELSSNTITGINPFNFSTKDNGEIYKCPNGDTIGLNLISEPFVINDKLIDEYDFIASKQKIGVKRGLLRPEPIYFCSQSFKKMIDDEKFTGFEFEITHIEES